jgi:hypothetical protein
MDDDQNQGNPYKKNLLWKQFYKQWLLWIIVGLQLKHLRIFWVIEKRCCLAAWIQMLMLIYWL